MSGWIWHVRHGWQYIYYEQTDSGVFVWDDNAESWMYTKGDIYPWSYAYSAGIWVYYMGGDAPYREFWDYGADARRTEASIFH